MLTIDTVVQTSLVAIYSRDLLSGKMFLKGGQALRIKENLISRFSADMDFSSPDKISNEDAFFALLEDALKTEFNQCGYYVFDLKWSRRPKIKKEDTPDFWGGWGVEFKLIEIEKNNMPSEQKSREALIPDGSSSPKITIDISEYEYCGSVEKIKLNAIDINVYSRTLLLVEKIRAICQQHPDYKFKGSDHRARDYYDIERLWRIVLKQGDPDDFLKDCALHLPKAFRAKDVDLRLLEGIFDSSFIELQRDGWNSVERTVKGRLEPFDYYVETLSNLIAEMKLKMPHRT